MLRRLVTFVVLGAFAFATPVLAAEKKSSGKKPAATKSSSKKKAPAKKAVAKPTATPAPVAEVAATPAPAKKKKLDRTFIRTTRAGWQEVGVGDKVIATKDDGSKVAGTIREVSDYSIVIEPKKTSSQQVEIASNDLAQVFRDAN